MTAVPGTTLAFAQGLALRQAQGMLDSIPLTPRHSRARRMTTKMKAVDELGVLTGPAITRHHPR